MSCGIPEYHEGQQQLTCQIIKRKDYPPEGVPTTAFGTPILWFNKLTIELNGREVLLYTFRTQSGSIETQVIGQLPKAGNNVRATIVPKSRRSTTRFCIVQIEVIA